MAVAMGGDGSVVLAGYTCGNWITTQVGACDVAVAKLDLNGTLLWTWQVTNVSRRFKEFPLILRLKASYGVGQRTKIVGSLNRTILMVRM